MRARTPIVLCLALVLVSLISAGCSRSSPRAALPEPAPTAEPTITPVLGNTTLVRVYFVRGEEIGVAGREVDPTEDVGTLAYSAIVALLTGPTPEEAEAGLITAIPGGTSVNDVDINGTTARVDLSEDFQSGGGSLSMLLRVAQVVCTLTQFDGVENVAFSIAGKPVSTIGGEGVIVDPPVDRTDFDGQLPAILVETPTPEQQVTSPLTVSGSSNVFEATHQLNITDPDGLILVEETVIASSGTGTRGTWSETITFGPVKRDGLGAVIVFEYSAKDGSQQNVVEIPVRMKK